MANLELSAQGLNPLLSLEPLRQDLKKYCLERVALQYRDIFDPSTYSATGLESQFKEKFDSGTPSITLLAPPGTGKSTLFCKIAQDWSDTNLVFFTDAVELQNSGVQYEQFIIKRCTEITEIDLSAGIELFKEFLLAQKISFIIIVDSVERLRNPAGFYNAFSVMQNALMHDRIRFLNACDDQVYYQADTRFFGRFTEISQWPDFSGVGFTSEEHFEPLVQSYFKHHEITTELAGKAREWCRVPLFLKLFSEVYHNQAMQRAETLKLKYLFDRYIATFCQKTASNNVNGIDANLISSFIERCALLTFRQRTTVVARDLFYSEMSACFSEKTDILKKLLINTFLCTVIDGKNTIEICFNHILFQSYVTARALVSEMQWDSKNNEGITADIADLIKRYDDELYFPFVLQALYLILESMRKNGAFIEELTLKKYGPKYKAILLRCFGWQNEMSIQIWQIIRTLERENDRQIAAATSFLKAMLFEHMPDDRTMELFCLPTMPAEKLRTEMLNRLRFDSTLSRLALQFKPYCHLTEIQTGIIRMLEQLDKIDSRPLQAGLLNIIELVLGYDVHKGIELMKKWQNFARSDINVLNTWCDVACRNASALFLDFWEIYVQTCMNDRQGAVRIIQFCLLGGQSSPSTALALIQKFWHLNTNSALREKTYSFITELGNLNAAAAIKILAAAKKENDMQPSPHKLETRELICKSSITCFEKNPSAFKPIIQEWLTHDDVKVKQLVKESLLRISEKSKS
jgi:hypothetical protein